MPYKSYLVNISYDITHDITYDLTVPCVLQKKRKKTSYKINKSLIHCKIKINKT